MPTRIGVSEIPLEANLEAKKFKHLRSDMDDLYVVFCIDLHTGDEYNLIVTEGLVYDYLEAIRRENNPFRFNIKRILDPESALCRSLLFRINFIEYSV